MNLVRLENKGAELNHSTYCIRIYFGGFVNPSEQVSESITRYQDQDAELSNNIWICWTTDLNITREWKTKGRDPNNIESFLTFLPDGLFI